MKKVQRLIAGVVLVLLAGACGSGSGGTETSGTQDSRSTSRSGSTATQPGTTSPAQPSLTLGLDGIGPLKIGMSESAAENTGWLSDRQVPWCPFASETDPSYQLEGPEAPAELDGLVIFMEGSLNQIVVRAGAATGEGIGIGTSTLDDLTEAYGTRGYQVDSYSRFEDYDDFATVNRGDETHLMAALGSGGEISLLGVPHLSVCD